jgi:hypothetical protein
LAVIVKETAEQVTSTHPALLILTDDGQPGRWIRRFEPQRPVPWLPQMRWRSRVRNVALTCGNV